MKVKTKLPEGCALEAIKNIANRAVVKFESVTLGDGLKALLRIKAKEVSDIISNLPSYCTASAVGSKEFRLLVKEHTCLVALPIIESGCLVTGVDIEGEEVVWSVMCDDESFPGLMEKLENLGMDFELLYKGKPEGKSEVTFREEEVLKLALEKGYFDFPRRIKLEELSKLLGVAPSTLSEIMRRGIKKILESYFESS